MVNALERCLRVEEFKNGYCRVEEDDLTNEPQMFSAEFLTHTKRIVCRLRCPWQVTLRVLDQFGYPAKDSAEPPDCLRAVPVIQWDITHDAAPKTLDELLFPKRLRTTTTKTKIKTKTTTKAKTPTPDEDPERFDGLS
jgi:hypothetical protein